MQNSSGPLFNGVRGEMLLLLERPILLTFNAAKGDRRSVPDRLASKLPPIWHLHCRCSEACGHWEPMQIGKRNARSGYVVDHCLYQGCCSQICRPVSWGCTRVQPGLEMLVVNLCLGTPVQVLDRKDSQGLCVLSSFYSRQFRSTYL